MNLTQSVKFLLKKRKFRHPPSGDGPAALIPAKRIHPDVRELVARLQSKGYTALVVGGAVRDLLLGRSPKDFDVSTTARPEQVQGLFRNARIIGRRFRLVHLTYPGMTVEVSTFRAPSQRKRGGMIVRDNTYGTPEEDAFRRDFTMNALACDPADGAVIDHVGGLADVREGVIRTIARPHVSLREDPVRMLRAVRFMVRLGFTLESELASAMTGMAGSLARVKRHRLAEETQRFLTKGNAVQIFQTLEQFGLLTPMLGLVPHKWVFAPEALRKPLPLLDPYLKALDRWIAAEQEPPSTTVALLGLVLALARPRIRGMLLGVPAGGRRKPASGLGKLNADLQEMLGNWGLLKGQVAPAMRILAAARSLPRKNGSEQRPVGDPPAGAREAWQLLALLWEQAGLEKGFAARAVREMTGLPVLPIFDHEPRRESARRGRPRHYAPRPARKGQGAPPSRKPKPARGRNRRAPAPANA
ncbi:MAG: CCA tRNA nucleotidyltransferase [SAR324 cluster bacterium]|nr:CCA tRNA nucleotidyltransferase [SAR324 cluster bacterium]